jgi:hypothetical protein
MWSGSTMVASWSEITQWFKSKQCRSWSDGTDVLADLDLHCSAMDTAISQMCWLIWIYTAQPWIQPYPGCAGWSGSTLLSHGYSHIPDVLADLDLHCSAMDTAIPHGVKGSVLLYRQVQDWRPVTLLQHLIGQFRDLAQFQPISC